MVMMDILDYLKLAVEKNVSDVFISAWNRISFKIEGAVVPQGESIIAPAEVEKMIKDLYRMADRAIDDYIETGSDNFLLHIPGLPGFKVRVYRQNDVMSVIIKVAFSERPRRRRALENSKGRKKNLAAILLLCVGITGVICFAAMIIMDLIKKSQDAEYYASLTFLSAPADDDFDYDNDFSYDESASQEPVSRTMTLDFESVQRGLPGALAWIRIDGTVIDYPVMYAGDNDYYLTRLPNGKESKSGSIFIDYRNKPDFSDQNTLIHGHRMKSGAMFGTLKYYNNQSYYDEHPTASIFTPEGDFMVMLFAGYRINHTVEAPPFSFKNADDFDKFVQSVKRRSIFKSDVEVNADDRLVCLCTCEYTTREGRLVIVGKLVEK